jgi:hypothetical protein
MAVVSLFNGAHTTVSSRQIARAHFGERSYGIAVVKDVKSRLKRIKFILDRDYSLPVVLVNADAYAIITNGGPTSRADAIRCLPRGKGRVSDGIHLCATKDDLIYVTSISMNLARGAGLEAANMDRLLGEHDRSGNITAETIAELVEDTSERREVMSPATLARIIRAREERRLLELPAAVNRRS